MAKKIQSVFSLEAIVFAAALIISLPLRTIQYFTIIESGTGFYNKIDANVYIYAAVCIIAAVFMIVSSFLKKKKVSLHTVPEKLPGCGVLSFVTAIAILYSSYKDYSLKNFDASEYTVSSTVSPIMVDKVALVSALFGLLAAVYFVLLSVCFISGKSCGGNFRFLSLTPVLWYVLKLVIRFTRTISYLRVSDLSIEMMSFAMTAMFLMAFAQCNAEINADDNAWKIGGFGFSSALLALNCFIPRAVLLLSGNPNGMYILSRTDVSDFAVALFIIATILTRMGPRISNIIVTPSEEISDINQERAE